MFLGLYESLSNNINICFDRSTYIDLTYLELGGVYFNPEDVMFADLIGGWHLCQLEVLECKEVPWPNAAVAKSYCLEDCGWPSMDVAYECKINLLTGRTHQVLQFS